MYAYGLEWLMGFLIVVFSRLPPSFHIFLSCPGGGADIERIRMGAPGMEFPHVLDRLVKFRFRVLFGAAVYHVFRFFIFKGGWKFNPWPIGHNPVYPPMVYPGRFFFPPHLFLRRRRARQAIEMIVMGRLFLDPVFWTF